MTSLIDKWSFRKTFVVHQSKMSSHLCDKLLNNMSQRCWRKNAGNFVKMSVCELSSQQLHVLSIACGSESWCDIVIQESDFDLVVC